MGQRPAGREVPSCTASDRGSASEWSDLEPAPDAAKYRQGSGGRSPREVTLRGQGVSGGSGDADDRRRGQDKDDEESWAGAG